MVGVGHNVTGETVPEAIREYYPGGAAAIPRTPEEVSNFEFRGIYGPLALLRFEHAGDVN